MLLDDLVADREPEPRAFADGLRREEGIEDAADDVACDARAGVPDRDDGASVLHARLDRDRARPGDRLRRVRKEIQEHLVDLRSNAFDRRQPAECPVHGDPVFEEVIDQREARFELLVQVHGLPDVGSRPREHAQIADDLAGTLGAFANALDHRVDVLERVVDLELFPVLVDASLLGVGERHRAVDVEDRAQALDEVVERADVRVDEADRIVQLVGDAGDELPHRGHLLPLDQLDLCRLQVAVRRLQLLVGRAELLGPHAHLVLEPARELLDHLEALGAIDGERYVVRDGRHELEIASREPVRLARGHRQHAEDPVLHPQRHGDERAHAEGADRGQVERRRAGLHVVDEKRQPDRRHTGDRARAVVEGQLHGLELVARAAGGLVAADDPSVAIDEVEVRRLVPHAVHQALDGLLVDLLGVEGGVHGGAEIDQQRELLDLGLEVSELLLELVVRVDDLFGLEVEQPLAVPAARALAQHHAEPDAGGERRRAGKSLADPRHTRRRRERVAGQRRPSRAAERRAPE